LAFRRVDMLNRRGGLVTKNYYRRGGVVSRNGYRKNISRIGFAPGGNVDTESSFFNNTVELINQTMADHWAAEEKRIREAGGGWVNVNVELGKMKMKKFGMETLLNTKLQPFITKGKVPTTEEVQKIEDEFMPLLKKGFTPDFQEQMKDTFNTDKEEWATSGHVSAKDIIEQDQELPLKTTLMAASPLSTASLLGAGREWFNKGKNIRVPGEDTAKWRELFKDSSRQLTRTDKAFKAGEKGLKGWRPLNAFTKKMLATGPDAATRQLLLRAPSLLSKVSPWIQGLMPGKLHAAELPEYGTPEYYEVMKQADERWKNYNNNNNTLLNRNSIAEGSAVNKKERRTKRIATAEKERREVEKYEAAQAAIAAKKAAETQRKAAAEAARKDAEEAAKKAAERPKNNWRNGVQTKESIDRGNRAVEQAGGSMDDFSDIPAPTPSRPTPSTSSRGPAGGPPPSSSRSSSRGGGNRWGSHSWQI